MAPIPLFFYIFLNRQRIKKKEKEMEEHCWIRIVLTIMHGFK